MWKISAKSTNTVPWLDTYINHDWLVNSDSDKVQRPACDFLLIWGATIGLGGSSHSSLHSEKGIEGLGLPHYDPSKLLPEHFDWTDMGVGDAAQYDAAIAPIGMIYPLIQNVDMGHDGTGTPWKTFSGRVTSFGSQYRVQSHDFGFIGSLAGLVHQGGGGISGGNAITATGYSSVDSLIFTPNCCASAYPLGHTRHSRYSLPSSEVSTVHDGLCDAMGRDKYAPNAMRSFLQIIPPTFDGFIRVVVGHTGVSMDSRSRRVIGSENANGMLVAMEANKTMAACNALPIPSTDPLYGLTVQSYAGLTAWHWHRAVTKVVDKIRSIIWPAVASDWSTLSESNPAPFVLDGVTLEVIRARMVFGSPAEGGIGMFVIRSSRSAMRALQGLHDQVARLYAAYVNEAPDWMGSMGRYFPGARNLYTGYAGNRDARSEYWLTGSQLAWNGARPVKRSYRGRGTNSDALDDILGKGNTPAGTWSDQEKGRWEEVIKSHDYPPRHFDLDRDITAGTTPITITEQELPASGMDDDLIDPADMTEQSISYRDKQNDADDDRMWSSAQQDGTFNPLIGSLGTQKGVAAGNAAAGPPWYVWVTIVCTSLDAILFLIGKERTTREEKKDAPTTTQYNNDSE